ncbi:MAG: ferredoxin [Ilumatobacteraceae bacterium]
MVWIDQDLCTGDGICSEICPDVFEPRRRSVGRQRRRGPLRQDDRLRRCTDDGHGPDMSKGMARIPDALIDDAIEAAEECPGECIMIEPYDQAAIDARGV